MEIPAPQFTKKFKIRSPSIYKIGGQSFTTSQIAALTGAPDGTDFKFHEVQGRLVVSGSHATYFDAKKPITRSIIWDGQCISIFNMEYSMLPSFHRQGNGFKMLYSQVVACREFEIDFISCLAGRWTKDEDGKKIQLDGYMVWPKLGFDGPIPDTTKDKIKATFPHCETVQQLIKSPGGWEEWETHGDTARLTFNVKSDSVNSQMLEAYGFQKGFLP